MKERGSIIVFAVLMLSVILTTGLALTAVFIPKLRSLRIATNAAVALYAADSGLELCLYETHQLTGTDLPVVRPLMTNGSDFVIASRSVPEVVITDSCIGASSTSFHFRVTGRFNGVSRAIEASQ